MNVLNNAAEVCFPLDALTLAGQRWHQGQKTKVLALHGWLDNAASFALLASELGCCDTVALDMAGHGQSDARPGRGAYNIWADTRELIQVLDQLAWPRCVLLGHSRGAMAATLLAAAFPERFDGLILIDAVVPLTSAESDLAFQLRVAVEASLERRKLNRRTYYQSELKAIEGRMNGLFPINKRASALLASRSLRKHEHKGWYWHYDTALTIPSEIRFSELQVKGLIENLAQPVLLLVASEGLFKDGLPSWLAQHKHIHLREFCGPHHLHLSCDADVFQGLITEIRQYISQITQELADAKSG